MRKGTTQRTRARTALAALVALGAMLAATPRASAQEALSPNETLYRELESLSPADRQSKIEAGARKEGSVALIQTVRAELGAGQIELFRKRYPYLKIEWTSDLGSPEAAERVYAEQVSGRRLTDAINVSISDLSELLARNFLARYATPARQAVLPQYRRFEDPQNRWVLSFWSDRGMSYNTNLVRAEDAPKDWMDLCKPAFKGNVSFDPVQARFIGGLYTALGDKVFDFFRCMGQNDPIIQRGPTQRVELMLAGDHMIVGDSYLYQGLAIKKRTPSAPYAMVLSAPIIASMGAVAINRNAPHPYAAALFADWMVSDEAQSYLAEQLRGPVTLKHPYLPADAKLVETPDIPKPVMDRLIDAWLKDVEKKR
jgi:iron(III) transport system substrate-binding protein